MFTFFILVTAIFIVIGVFFPEWVGITGKKAHEIQQHQQEEKPEVKTEDNLNDNSKPQ